MRKAGKLAVGGILGVGLNDFSSITEGSQYQIDKIRRMLEEFNDVSLSDEIVPLLLYVFCEKAVSNELLQKFVEWLFEPVSKKGFKIICLPVFDTRSPCIGIVDMVYRREI